MNTLFGSNQAIALLLLAGFFSNEIWRVIGLFVGGRIRENSEVLVWVRCIAAAILAGVIAQILIAPPGALATVPAFVRFGAAGIGFIAYLAARKSVFAGVIAGEAIVLLGKLWFAP